MPVRQRLSIRTAGLCVWLGLAMMAALAPARAAPPGTLPRGERFLLIRSRFDFQIGAKLEFKVFARLILVRDFLPDQIGQRLAVSDGRGAPATHALVPLKGSGHLGAGFSAFEHQRSGIELQS